MPKTQTVHIDNLSQLLKVCREDGLPTQIKIDTHKLYKPHIFWGFTGYIGLPIHQVVVENLFSLKLIWLHSITCTNRYKHFVVTQDFIELLDSHLKSSSGKEANLAMDVDDGTVK